MQLIVDHRQTRTDEGATGMRSGSEHDEDPPDGPYVYHRLVGQHWLDPDDPSQCDRAAIVLGQLSNPHGAAGPHRAGERREGPTSSMWRSELGALPWPPAAAEQRLAGGRHRLTGRHRA